MSIKRRYIVLAIVLFFGLFIALGVYQYFRNTGLLELTTPSKIPGNRVSVEVMGQETQTMDLGPGEIKKIRLQKGDVRINSSSGNIKSIDIVEIKTGQTSKLKIPGGEQRSVQQIGTNANSCPTIIKDRLYSYGCTEVGGVVRHDAVLSLGNPFLFGAQSFGQPNPLKDGVLGFSDVTGSRPLVYADFSNQTIQNVPISDSLRVLVDGEMPLIVTDKSPGGTMFALVFSLANKVFLFDNITDTSPAEINPPKDISFSELGRLVSVSFYKDSMLLFVGAGKSHGEGQTETDSSDKKLQPSYLFEYDNRGQLKNTVDLPDIVNKNHFFKLPNNFFVAEGGGEAEFYYQDGKKIRSAYIMNDISNWVVSNDVLYIQVGGTIYQFIPGANGTFSLHSRFYSEKLPVSGLYGSSLGVLFTAFAGNQTGAPLNVFWLSDKLEQDSRAIDLQPLDYGGLDILLNLLTADQLYNLKFALSRFSESGKGFVASNIDPVPHDRLSANNFDTINLTIRTEDKKTSYRARLDYGSLYSIRLYLYDEASGKLLFDSSTITIKPPEKAN